MSDSGNSACKPGLTCSTLCYPVENGLKSKLEFIWGLTCDCLECTDSIKEKLFGVSRVKEEPEVELNSHEDFINAIEERITKMVKDIVTIVDRL